MSNFLPVKENSVILQSDHGESPWLLFEDPIEIITASSAGEVAAAFEKVSAALHSNRYLAGFLSYEAAAGIDTSFKVNLLRDFPYLWFGAYAQPKAIDFPGGCGEEYRLGDWRASLSWEEYQAAIEKIKKYIREGDTYQVNFTYKMLADFSGDAWSLFNTLYKAQHSHYSAFINTGRYKILSVSPELFFRLNNDHLVARPMKGTMKRGLSYLQDRQQQQWLQQSIKNRAENLMIVDMIRNDIGRVARPGSVHVERLFEIEKYPTLHQMTSTVSATTTSSAVDVLRAMFPCASITGAPKVKTMEIIGQLETGPRGIYTGSIGYIQPNGSAQFNVAIRTVTVDVEQGQAEYGVGGGVVWDSEPEAEYVECHTKAEVLTKTLPDFELLESMLWTKEHGIVFLEEHLRRLQHSADYFAFPYPEACIRAALQKASEALSDGQYKFRLTLSAKGKLAVQHQPLESLIGKTIVLATQAAQTQSVFCYHKITHREIYNRVLAEHAGYDDVILYNEAGYITETTVCNIVMNIDGEWLTPAVDCGLLDGVYRQKLLGQEVLQERLLRPTDLQTASEVYLINSVRGWLGLRRRESSRDWVIDREFGFVELSSNGLSLV